MGWSYAMPARANGTMKFFRTDFAVAGCSWRDGRAAAGSAQGQPPRLCSGAQLRTVYVVAGALGTLSTVALASLAGQPKAAVPTRAFLTAHRHAQPSTTSPHQSAAQTTVDQSAASHDSRRTELRFRECPPDSQLRCRYRRDTWPADHSPSPPAGTQLSGKSGRRSHPLS